MKETNKKEKKKELIKSEVNFLEKPFYALSKDRFKRIKCEWEDIIIKNGEKIIIKRSWEVAPEIKMGLPTVFDMKVFRIIEMFIQQNLKQNGKISDSVNIGSRYQLCKILGIENHSGNRKLIEEAIKRLAFTGFIAGNSFNLGKKRYTSRSLFHLFDYTFKGEELKNGDKADSNYLHIGPVYKKSIENYYIKLLDFTYIKSLKSGIAIRLYDLLGLKFFGIVNKDIKFIKYSYEKLCKFLPVKEYKYLSDIKRQLLPSLNELKETKFLDKYSFETKNKKLFIKFYPGTKYFDEIKLEYAPKQKTLAEIKKIREILKRKDNVHMPKYFKKQLGKR